MLSALLLAFLIAVEYVALAQPLAAAVVAVQRQLDRIVACSERRAEKARHVEWSS